MRRALRVAVVAAAVALALSGCDVAALGTGRTDCGQLASVECREALLLAAARIGPAPGEVIADRTCMTDGDCTAPLDWVVVYPLEQERAIALRIVGTEPNAPVEVTVVTEVPDHVGVRLPIGSTFLESPPPRRSP